MALPISVRLFLAGLVSMTLAGLVGLGLVRWRLGEDPTPMAAQEARHIDALVHDLSMQYDAHGSWRFLPADAGARAAWLHARLAATAHSDAMADDSTLGARLALSDRAGHLIAGGEPSRVLVALASIDRRRWPLATTQGNAGYVTVAVPRNADDALTVAFLMRKQHSLALLAVAALALSALAAAIVAAGFRRPIAALVDGARRLGAGQLDARIGLTRRDELGELARAFDDLGARLDAASRSRRRWIADTSHELRTPLAVLRAQIEAMQDGIRPLSLDGLASMAAQVASLQALVDDLDQLARGDVGTLVLASEPMDIWAVVRATWDAFGERLRERGLDARIDASPSRAHGIGDAARIAQVLRNLLENSARYTPPGGGVLLSGHVDGAQLHVHVDDSAPGVPADALAQLGERFFRVDASRSRAHGGSGLGLALCRQIVEAHGGRLDFEASPLGGLRAHHTAAGACMSATVLIVEDEPELSRIVADYVRAAGHVAVVVHDGREAYAGIASAKPDVIVLDLMLPGVDGLTLCRDIRRASDVPIIMTTAKVEEVDRVIGLESGADDYVCKPYSPRELMARIGAQLRRRMPLSPPVIVVDDDARSARMHGRPLDLTPAEFAILAALSRRPDVVFSRAQLLDAVGRDNLDVTERAIDSHVKNLRRKLAACGGGDAIQSVYGAGYRLES